MRSHLLAAVVAVAAHNAHAEDGTTLPAVRVVADKPSDSDSSTVVENRQDRNRTLGQLLEQVSGVQNSAFGPNAGAPIIRSLTGSRVRILEDGQSVLGMNALSGNIGIPFDPLFTRTVTVNKSSDAVRHGGNAIGGSVDIDPGLISRTLDEKPRTVELVIRQGFNDFDAQGLRVNFNDQQNVSTNLQLSRQRISDYAIPGNSKAGVCNSHVFLAGGGVNTSLADSCQKEARFRSIYNNASQPYIDQFMTENPDWADGEFSFYTDQPSSVWQGRTYQNPPNPDYVPGTPAFVQQQINRDVTPDYHRRLGNSYSNNTHLGIGSTYFFDRGHVGASFDAKDSRYGVPGFSMENQSFSSDYEDRLPVGVVIAQEKLALEASLRDPARYLEGAELRAVGLNNTSGEYLGRSIANEYTFETAQMEALLAHRPLGALSGMVGVVHQDRDVTGTGPQRYLPDVLTRTRAVFLKERLDLGWIAFDAGYRDERVSHEVDGDGFSTARNSPNGTPEDREFRLASHEIGAQFELGRSFGARLRYSSSERAPEINELYASNYHFSVMMQEEGNHDLEAERARNIELTALFNKGGFNASATGYVMEYDNYLYPGHSGLQTANRLPLKYWKQTDTTIKGFELDLSQQLDLKRYGLLDVSAFTDLVRNRADDPGRLRERNDGVTLPNMPVNRYGVRLEWQRDDWTARLSSTYHDKQKYLGRNVTEEVPLDAYNMVDMQISRELRLRNPYVTGVELFLNGSNLLDADARPHTSPLKYIAPLPGRGFQLGVTVRL